MRDILFRAKTIDSGIWVEGDLVHRTESDGLLTILIENNDFHDYRSYEVTSETVGQFTGLLDKTKAKVFEGDIVKTETDKPMVVSWNTKFASYCLDRDGWAFTHWFGEACDPEKVEIIGNIHDNQELIGKEASNG